MVAAISAKANAQDRVAITRSGSMPLILRGQKFRWESHFYRKSAAPRNRCALLNLNFSQLSGEAMSGFNRGTGGNLRILGEGSLARLYAVRSRALFPRRGSHTPLLNSI